MRVLLLECNNNALNNYLIGNYKVMHFIMNLTFLQEKITSFLDRLAVSYIFFIIFIANK